MLALDKAVKVFGSNMVVITDNGTENYKHAYNYLKSPNISLCFARPHTPKDKPHAENLTGKLQQECLNEYRGYMNLKEREQQIITWHND